MGTVAPNVPFPPPRVAPNQSGGITSRGETACQAVNTIAPMVAVSSCSGRSTRGRQERDHAPKYVATRRAREPGHPKSENT